MAPQGKSREGMLAAKRREEARLKKKEEEDRRLELFAACRGGDVEEVRMVTFGLRTMTSRTRLLSERRDCPALGTDGPRETFARPNFHVRS